MHFRPNTEREEYANHCASNFIGMIHEREAELIKAGERIQAVNKVVPAIRIDQCIGEIAASYDKADQRLALYRLLADMIPDQRIIQQHRRWHLLHEERVRKSEDKLTEVRETAYKLLCDAPTKNDLLRGLEKIMDITLQTEPEEQ